MSLKDDINFIIGDVASSGERGTQMFTKPAFVLSVANI